MRFFVLKVILILLVNCNTGSQIRNFLSSSTPKIYVGRYPHYFRLMSDEEIEKRKIAPLIKDGLRHRLWLEQELKAKLGISLPTPIKYFYTGYDSVNQRIVIRYFAADPQPLLTAGWQLQLIYLYPALVLDEIYLDEIPLE